MTTTERRIHVGNTTLRKDNQPPQGEYVQLLGESYYRIEHVDQMPPFFMSLVSGADHWLFVASNGGLTAGRRNAEAALFPYETEDKLIAHSDQVGSTTLLRVTRHGRAHLWEPLSNRYEGLYRCQRNLYKNIYGNKLIFEAINHDLQLTWRVAWRTGDRFGFVRSCWLQNDGDACDVALLDGLQNLLPHGATLALQTSFSNLLHAYKRNELDPATGLGIFALSATLTDRAEPSESLLATVAWQVGLSDVCHLLCNDQIDAFRYGEALAAEEDERGKAGSYFVNTALHLDSGETRHWHLVADVEQDSAAIVQLQQLLHQEATAVEAQLEADIEETTDLLVRYVAAADGLQETAGRSTSAHHFANVMFNIMRGGIFVNGYRLRKPDLLDFIRTRNRLVLEAHAAWFAGLPDEMEISDLYAQAAATGCPDLERLCYEYLPLTFSRRHGDPSRPWNRFSINLKHPDGSPRLDFQGNWRDIFQNWEPLVVSFPDYIEGLIAKFLNATTADGYNPYRVTRAGIEWEVPEPDSPWANIGYWSDHQIIYLQKLLEIAEQVHPGALSRLWNRAIFAYADVPYRLRPYEAMLSDWYNTIEFDWESQEASEEAVSEMGNDGRLLRNALGQVMHVTMAEKLLTLLLAKLTNLVPEGGIWMNTQRPEWNDANNALVGKGLSVVTVAYLRRFLAFWRAQLAAEVGSFTVNETLAALFADVQRILSSYEPHLATGFDNGSRRAVMDELGAAASAYRTALYDEGLPETQVELDAAALLRLLTLAQAYIEHTLRANRRPDNLYHAYNILDVRDGQAAVAHLYPMLEGQVAVLSSGILAPEESLVLLQSLRHSDLYRPNQHSYMLYPNRDLPGFLQKNNVPVAAVAGSPLVDALTAAGDRSLLIQDGTGVYHFNGNFRNAGDVTQALDVLAQEPAYSRLVASERDFILDLFESTFNHNAFTGRSSTFFAYEGLGSIYWHMVSKLLLAAQEAYQAAVRGNAEADVVAALADAYYDIRAGLGFNKTAAVYGAFPTDPYSHTPWGGGARQPGMTGQVKEEILTRWGELGVSVRDGVLEFAPTLLHHDEFVEEATNFTHLDADGRWQSLALPPDSLAFTFCQTPVVYTCGERPEITVRYADGHSKTTAGHQVDRNTSQQIFDRDGQVGLIRVTVC